MSNIQISVVKKIDPKTDKKIDKLEKNFDLYQVLMHRFLSRHVQIFPNYKLLTKKINIFSSGSMVVCKALVYFEPKIRKEIFTKFKKMFELHQAFMYNVLHKTFLTFIKFKRFWTISSFYVEFFVLDVLNIFWYTFWDKMCQI